MTAVCHLLPGDRVVTPEGVEFVVGGIEQYGGEWMVRPEPFYWQRWYAKYLIRVAPTDAVDSDEMPVVPPAGITTDAAELLRRGFELDSNLTQAMFEHAVNHAGVTCMTIYTAAMVAQQYYEDRAQVPTHSGRRKGPSYG